MIKSSDMLKLNPEARLVAAVARKVAGWRQDKPEGLLDFNSINWPKAKGMFAYHELTPFVYPALKETSPFLPQGLRESLKNDYYCALARCQRFRQEFLRISSAFKSAGITLLPIKGAALLEDIYAHMPARPMVDIDLLVKENDINKSKEVFSALGYKKRLDGLKEEYWRQKQCHIAFQREGENPFIAELHWSLDFKRNKRDILAQLWSRVREIKAGSKSIELLSPEDTFFSLALHQRRMGKALCLKNVCDTLLLLNKYSNSFDWNYVLEEAEKSRARTTLFFLLVQTGLLGFKIPSVVERRLNLPRWKKRLIQRFIRRNTFLPLRGREKEMYLKSHFLLYDSVQEPVKYIFNIPPEQFSKFYGLKPYSRKAGLFYRGRLAYIPFKAVLNLVWRLKNGKDFSF